jgi:molybdopterin converting factor small subunit
VKIKVLFFARLRETFGASEKIVEIQEGGTIRDLAESLFGRESDQLSSLLYAVNENFALPDRCLVEWDCLAIMTPVSGG